MKPNIDLGGPIGLSQARKLLGEHAGKSDKAALTVMALIANHAQRNQAGWGRIRLQALRELGRWLIQNGRSQGRPSKKGHQRASKTSAGDVLELPGSLELEPRLVSLADIGITDRHLSADAKQVGRIPERDFTAYLRKESEPTLRGLFRYAVEFRPERQHEPYPHKVAGTPPRGKPNTRNIGANYNTQSVPLQGKRSFLAETDTSTVEWYTPREIFDSMGMGKKTGRFFDVDVCSPGRDVVPHIPARRHLTRKENGLAVSWQGFAWMNAPYGIRNGIEDWIAKFIEHGNGVTIVPDFTSTEWWHTLTASADLIMFVRPKVYFLPKRPDGRTNSLGSTLVAIGEQGVQALLRAQEAGRGLCFARRDSGAQMLMAAE